MSDDRNQTDIINNYSEISSVNDSVIIPQINPVKKPKKGPYDIKTYEDLLEALEESRRDIKEGRLISHEVMMEKLKRYAEEE